MLGAAEPHACPRVSPGLPRNRSASPLPSLTQPTPSVPSRGAGGRPAPVPAARTPGGWLGGDGEYGGAPHAPAGLPLVSPDADVGNGQVAAGPWENQGAPTLAAPYGCRRECLSPGCACPRWAEWHPAAGNIWLVCLVSECVPAAGQEGSGSAWGRRSLPRAPKIQPLEHGEGPVAVEVTRGVRPQHPVGARVAAGTAAGRSGGGSLGAGSPGWVLAGGTRHFGSSSAALA